jgi:glycine hydroxymethyltransferase
MFTNIPLDEFDVMVSDILTAEQQRQEAYLTLIASENYASPLVMAMQGSVFTNKYAEGYPGKRYYGGCEMADLMETQAIERAKLLFAADYVNVQPHSGSQANAAAYAAILEPGDVVLGMSLAQGGHLTHGAKVNFSGKIYHAYAYGLQEKTGDIDYQQVADLAQQYRPKLIIAGFSAYSRVIDWHRFRAIADDVGAYLLADIAHVAGLIATNLYPSPVNIADITTSTTHKTLRGPRGGLIFAKHNPILVNKLQSAVFPGLQGGPLMHVIAAKAVAFHEALQPSFTQYQQQVIANARLMAQVCQQRGYQVVSGGTDNHMFLLDLSNAGITGKAAEDALGRAHLTVNKNSIPHDRQKPTITSGIRIGTPAVTTRGLGLTECQQVANLLCDILADSSNEHLINKVRQQVHALCQRFPVYCAA